MATKTEDTIFKVKIEGVEREVKSLKDLKQAKKDATDAFLKGDNDAAKALAELKDKTEDLADATRSLKTDGVEPLTGSFSLFKEGLGSGDVDKFKLGLKGIGAAMSALPIFLLIEGVKALIENFDEIVKLFDTGKTKSEQMTIALEEQKKAYAVLSGTISNQIKLLTEQGGSEAKILALKKELIAIGIKQAEGDILIQKQKIKEIILNDSLIESGQKLLAQQQRAIGNTAIAEAIEKSIAIDKQKRIKEASEALTQNYLTIQNLRTEDKINEIKDGKERNTAYKKHLEDKAKIKEENDAYYKKRKKEQDEADRLAEQEALRMSNQNVITEEVLTQDQINAIKAAASAKATEDDLNAKKDKRERDRKELIDDVNQNLAITRMGLESTQNLSDLFFSIKQANLKKGSVEEEKAARNQFKINKALGIAAATINGAQAVTAILAVPDFTLGLASALRIAGAAIATGATIAKIAGTQFNSSGSQDSGSGSAISLPSVNTTAPTTQSQPQTTTTFTGNNNNNFNQPLQAVVIESQGRKVTDRINKLTSESSYG